jgi:hypothetical protein
VCDNTALSVQAIWCMASSLHHHMWLQAEQPFATCSAVLHPKQVGGVNGSP